MAGYVQIFGGGFQDSAANPLANGSMEWVLNQDAALTTSPYGLFCPLIVASVTLDSTGNVPNSPVISLARNDQMLPAGTYYTVCVFDVNGARVYGPVNWQLNGAGPIDISTLM